MIEILQDDFFERCLIPLCIEDHFVQISDIGQVMLSMVVLKRFFRELMRKCFDVIGQLWKFEHLSMISNQNNSGMRSFASYLPISSQSMQIALKYLEKIRKLYSQPSQKQRCKLSVADTESMLSKLIMFHYPDSDDRPIIKIWKPVVIVGDLNGQVMDLLKIMELEGQGTPSKHYLFLGNYIQGAQYGLQTILIIFCLKLKYPDYIHILRGSTQTKSIAQSIGFQEDCCLYPGEEKGSQIPKNAKSMAYGMFLTIFARLPIIGVIQNKIFCVHGGLTPHSENVQDYFEMAGQEKEPRQSEVTDLLWSKFSEDIQGYRYNEKKRIGHLFGPDQVFSFLKTNDYDLMINSGEFLPNGYRITCEEKLITIYSASNFLKYYKNTGCYLKVSQDLQVSFVILKPKFPAEDEDPIIKVRNTEESREFKKEKKHG